MAQSFVGSEISIRNYSVILRPLLRLKDFLNSGVGVGTVRRLLGHRNLQTTQRYAELSGETVRHELDAFARRKTRTR